VADIVVEKRFRLGILFYFSPKWMGGIVYIHNLIKILDFLNDEDKPEVVVFYRAELRTYAEQVTYPYMRLVEWDFPSVYNGYIRSLILGKNIFVEDILKRNNLDGLYPINDYPVRTMTDTRIVSWFADLQHKYYPEFFTWRKILERNWRIRFMLKNSKYLVVSSKSVADDFIKFYRVRNEMRVRIFHFVSIIDDFKELDINYLLKKYKLPERYFIVSNQFHRHKNHIVLLKALVRLKEKRPDIHIAITGRLPDSSHSSYIKELHSVIDRNKLQSQISMLGVIPRNEQLLLMKYSQAVLQPSLFEGWSTVIEDAISLQVPVIASSIAVNREQLGPDGNFFQPHNDQELADILADYPERKLGEVIYEDYNIRVKRAAKDFISIFQEERTWKIVD